MITYLRASPLLPGGGYTHTVSVVHNLKKNFEVDFIYRTTSGDRFPFLSAFIAQFRLLKRVKTKITYLRHSSFCILTVFLPFSILEYNGSEAWVKKHWGRGKFLLPLVWLCEVINIQFADKFVVVSEPLKNELMQRGIGGGDIFVCPNGVDVDFFKPQESDARIGLMIPKNETVIGFFGTFGPWHGVEDLAYASGFFQETYLMVGDGSMRLDMQRLFGDANVRWVGMIQHYQIPNYMNACDILVLATRPNPDGTEFFGSPTKLFEYMAVGKCVVASCIGTEGILTDGVDAFIYDPRKGKMEIVFALQRAINGDRKKMGENARKKSLEYTWEKTNKKLIDFLKD